MTTLDQTAPMPARHSTELEMAIGYALASAAEDGPEAALAFIGDFIAGVGGISAGLSPKEEVALVHEVVERAKALAESPMGSTRDRDRASAWAALRDLQEALQGGETP